VEDMTAKVKEALLEISEDDIIVVHCFDNIAFMARSEEGGDLPIRRFPDGVYHMEGDLVLASTVKSVFTCTLKTVFHFSGFWKEER
jgi:hypothetical protein